MPSHPPKTHEGRDRVGVLCKDGPRCKNSSVCKNIYTQDLLSPDGTCPEFKEKEDECIEFV